MKSLDSDYPGVCVLSCMVIFRLARRGWEEGCQARLSRRGFSPCPPGNIGLWALNCLWMGVTPVKSFSSLSFRLFTWTPEFKTLSLSSVVLRIKWVDIGNILEFCNFLIGLLALPCPGHNPSLASHFLVRYATKWCEPQMRAHRWFKICLVTTL